MIEWKDRTGRVVGRTRAYPELERRSGPAIIAQTAAERHGIPEGWEIKSGFIMAPDERRGTYEQFWPVLALAKPQMKAILTWEYRSSFLGWLQKAGKLGTELAESMLSLDERKALSEGTDTAGGFLVPPELSNQILVTVRERSTVRQNARTMTTSSDRVSIGSFDFSASWVGEAPASSESTITPIQTANINVYKLRVKAKCSSDLFNDQSALLGWLDDAGAQEIANGEDQASIAGTGVLQPLGFIQQLPATSIIAVDGSTAHTISNTTSADGSRGKLVSLEADLPDT